FSTRRSRPISRRPVTFDLHLLSPVSFSRSASGFDPPDVGRSNNTRDRSRISIAGNDDGPETGSGKAKDSARADFLRTSRAPKYLCHAGPQLGVELIYIHTK